MAVEGGSEAEAGRLIILSNVFPGTSRSAIGR